MQSDNKFLDDMAKVVSGAMSTAFDAKDELDKIIKGKIDSVLQKADVVSREEFEVVKEMAVKARTENEKLKKKIAALEKKVKK